MPQSYDIMIRNGWLRGEDTATRDIAVGDGKIVEISAALAGNAETEIDTDDFVADLVRRVCSASVGKPPWASGARMVRSGL